MSKKGGFWDNPFGGMFDFNGDGKEDFGEQFIGYKIFGECTKEDYTDGDFLSNDLDFHVVSFKDYSWRNYVEVDYLLGVSPENYETEEEYLEAVQEAKYAWRNYAEVDYLLGIFPENYETEEEYLEAVQEAKYAWRNYVEVDYLLGIFPEHYETEDEYNKALKGARDTYGSGGSVGPVSIGLSFSVGCSDPDKFGTIKESDFPNKRRYNAAHTLADKFLIYSNEKYERQEKACCKFILEEADKVIAADYLTHDKGFIYAQAVKDNFELPISLPDEDETPEYGIHEILSKIARKDIDLSLKVWSWLVDNFLPYAHYYSWAKRDLTLYVFKYIGKFPDKFIPALAHYLNDNPEFCNTVISAYEEVDGSLSTIIAEAIKEGLLDFSVELFKLGLRVAGGRWKEINKLTGEVLCSCKNREELESIEFFQTNMLPLVKAIDIGMVQDEIEGWENEIAEHIAYVGEYCEKYAMTRSNAWRATVSDGPKYGLNPRWYDSEEEYLADLNEHKYGWREWYKGRDIYGLDVNDFETQVEFNEAFNIKLEEMRQKKREAREQECRQRQAERQREIAVITDDKTIYTICGISFPHAVHAYHYRTEDTTLKIGDTVLVPVGDKEAKGTVISVGQYMRHTVPFPVDKMKTIISKV